MDPRLPFSHLERAANRGTALDRSKLTPFGVPDHLEPSMCPVEHVDRKLKDAYKFYNVEQDWGLEKELVALERRPYAAALLDCAEKAARAAGALIRGAYAEGAAKPSFETKSNPTDMVTDTDKKCAAGRGWASRRGSCEDLIVGMIKERFSGHAIMGEESACDELVLTDDPTWIIDPLDGTTNFVHGLPQVSVSVAVYVCKAPVAGCVYFPLADEMFTATVRGGAYLNGERISTSGCESLSQACLATDFGYDRTAEGVKQQSANMQNVLVSGKVQAIRITGGCCYNLCSIACGRLDAYFEGRDISCGPKPWDWAAGALIVSEAGGWVGAYDGTPLDIFSGKAAVTASEPLRNQLLPLID